MGLYVQINVGESQLKLKVREILQIKELLISYWLLSKQFSADHFGKMSHFPYQFSDWPVFEKKSFVSNNWWYTKFSQIAKEHFKVWLLLFIKIKVKVIFLEYITKLCFTIIATLKRQINLFIHSFIHSYKGTNVSTTKNGHSVNGV